VDDLLDAAVRLFAHGGARAVTMSAVAREAGAPSGSVYHRFADRAGMLAALWLRTASRFQDGFRDVVGTTPDAGAAATASAWTVDWCREHLDEAVVLQAGARAFSLETWSAGARAALEAHNRQRDVTVRDLVSGLAATTGRESDEVVLALFDLPHAVVARYLGRGEPPPASASDLAARVTRSILDAS